MGSGGLIGVVNVDYLPIHRSITDTWCSQGLKLYGSGGGDVCDGLCRPGRLNSFMFYSHLAECAWSTTPCDEMVIENPPLQTKQYLTNILMNVTPYIITN